MIFAHRHSIFCILPPHILTELAKNGTPEQRDYALRALDLDATLRTTRLTTSLLRGVRPTPVAEPMLAMTTRCSSRSARALFLTRSMTSGSSDNLAKIG